MVGAPVDPEPRPLDRRRRGGGDSRIGADAPGMERDDADDGDSGAGELGEISDAVISSNSIHDNSGGSIGLTLPFASNPFIPPLGFAQNLLRQKRSLNM